MKKYESDIMNELLKKSFINQRILADNCGHSLGVVNKSLKFLLENGYINEHIQLTNKAKKEFERKKPKSAIILAAGFGMRMVPINLEMPKALLEVNSEVLIERIIKQIHAVGIYEIYVVVGFMKEKFEYLIDEYGVELVINKDYAIKNNLHSLKLVLDKLDNSYIIPGDIWCDQNPFSRHELYSWYMVSDLIDDDSSVRVNRKNELVYVNENEAGNQMIGISYLLEEEANVIRDKIKVLAKNKHYDQSFWEEALLEKNKMIVNAKVVHASDVVEINTYEELRELDADSNHLKSDAIDIIANTLGVEKNKIYDITVLKKGMTNRSFLFSVKNEKYIMRIPGEGTDELINRKEEASVYKVIKDKNICDDIIYINSENGYKITRYIEGARCCDVNRADDLKTCMKRLKEFHQMELKVNHEFNIFEKINFYESLWNEKDSIYKDYQKTKENILSLKEYIDRSVEKKVLAHIDAVPDNFLFTRDGDIRLIDWEYAAMQDPHVDIAMFCIYAMYDEEQVDQLINFYFEDKCDKETRIKIYAYIAACGLLWSNWCEYKLQLGVEFGEYSIKQYRYAKEYYHIVKRMLGGK
ncbi:phosphotransferase [Clostridium paraputrificum]|uniref:phosphotransferase n=1 Tax=Clostridium paraputrificum TaxID=29363 RepID=UPI00189EFB4D|nr:phosphotransferase [Clostridium paraputrificum]MDB2116091.1 phosphotransferase [Clostridium paraputrificum]